MRQILTALIVAFALLAPAAAHAATAVGAVSRIDGPCTGVSEGKTRTLADKMLIHLDESVSTGTGARLEITFEDGTKFTLGEKAKVTIDTFVYRPSGKGNRLRFSAAGPFRFISGKLSKTAGATASVVTPVATIGIRGTNFWGGPIDGQFGVFLFEGAVAVATTAGETVLDTPGEGVNLIVTPPLRGRPAGSTTQSVRRGAVTMWSNAKIDRALATVTFQ
jgi:hypothetical protein